MSNKSVTGTPRVKLLSDRIHNLSRSFFEGSTQNQRHLPYRTSKESMIYT